MAIAQKEKGVRTVGQLKLFLSNIPDTVRVCGGFQDKVTAYWWTREKNETGFKDFVTLDDEIDA